jgi:hypothetical protein
MRAAIAFAHLALQGCRSALDSAGNDGAQTKKRPGSRSLEIFLRAQHLLGWSVGPAE